MRKLNDLASIAPLIIVFLIIAIAGLLIGILTVMMNAVSNSDNNINGIFTLFWAGIGVVVLIVLVFWAMVKAQRS